MKEARSSKSIARNARAYGGMSQYGATTGNSLSQPNSSLSCHLLQQYNQLYNAGSNNYTAYNMG